MGDVSDDDRQQNDLSIDTGLRLISIYRLPDGAKVQVITEWNRSHITIRLAGDIPIGPRLDDPMTGRNWLPPQVIAGISDPTTSFGLQVRLEQRTAFLGDRTAWSDHLV